MKYESFVRFIEKSVLLSTHLVLKDLLDDRYFKLMETNCGKAITPKRVSIFNASMEK